MLKSKISPKVNFETTVKPIMQQKQENKHDNNFNEIKLSNLTIKKLNQIKTGDDSLNSAYMNPFRFKTIIKIDLDNPVETCSETKLDLNHD